MERRTRSRITMGTSVKQFSVAHPMESSGHQAAVGGLDSVLAEARTLEDQQREGIITERRGATVRREVIDRLWDVNLPHLWAAALGDDAFALLVLRNSPGPPPARCRARPPPPDGRCS